MLLYYYYYVIIDSCMFMLNYKLYSIVIGSYDPLTFLNKLYTLISLIKYLLIYKQLHFPLRPEHVGNALITILEQGKNGETWIVEDNKPPRLVDY